ncbi:MAG: histidine kinase [Saprospiraceae bacterium]|nr:histidine kinase [Saprospiraceae bacterium]
MSEFLAKSFFTILYVDDEEENLVSFRATFRRDYNVLTALTGKEGIEILRNEHVDLVITDQRMPEMTGVEFLEKILPEFPETTRIVITGYSDIEAVIGAINRGEVYRYITKPWDTNELKMTIENARQMHYLKKENVMAQFEVLKNQINPHFLFNTFSSLINLIEENQDEAVAFVEKLSSVYRYVLLSKDIELTELSNEMEFISTYISLLSQRFGKNLKINNLITKHSNEFYVPPLSMQLLIENAVKHNVISSKKPLTIEISIDDKDYVVVKNNLQKKSSTKDSTNVGLKNIKNRFRYFTQKQVNIIKNNEFFIVELPLLNAKTEKLKV